LATASRKEAILEAARGEFADHGYSGARIERIAAAAGANKQLIFHYFGSKDGLYAAVAAATFLGAPDSQIAAPTPTESLRRCVAEMASWLGRTSGAALLVSECVSGRPVPTEAERTVSSWVQRASSNIHSAIDDGQRKGYFRDDIDAQFIATLIVGSSVGNALLARGGSGAVPGSASRSASLLAQVAVDLCAWR
jgi:TetR/AcrR family transcriptional regulator